MARRSGGPATERHRVNKRIRAREIRVIDPEGQQLGIMPPELAMAKAQQLGLDLVEISPHTRPPVCKIMDYGKFKYDQKKKAAEAKRSASQTLVKEVKFRLKIEKHDYDTKVARIKRFLGEGHKVKVTMMFRGREITRQDLARGIMERVVNDCVDSGSVEFSPKVEGRNMIMIMAPGRASSSRTAPPAGGAGASASGYHSRGPSQAQGPARSTSTRRSPVPTQVVNRAK